MEEIKYEPCGHTPTLFYCTICHVAELQKELRTLREDRDSYKSLFIRTLRYSVFIPPEDREEYNALMNELHALDAAFELTGSIDQARSSDDDDG